VQTLSYAPTAQIAVNITACANHFFQTAGVARSSAWFNLNGVSVSLSASTVATHGTVSGQNGLYGACLLSSSMSGAGTFYVLVNELEVFGHGLNLVGFGGLQATVTSIQEFTNSHLLVTSTSGCFNYAVTATFGHGLSLTNSPLYLTNALPTGGVCFGTLSGGTCTEQTTNNELVWNSPPQRTLTFAMVNANPNQAATTYVLAPAGVAFLLSASPVQGIGTNDPDTPMVCTRMWGYTNGNCGGGTANGLRLFAGTFASPTTLTGTSLQTLVPAGAGSFAVDTVHYTLPVGAQYQMQYTTLLAGTTLCSLLVNVACYI
jgi:hypothetical protein